MGGRLRLESVATLVWNTHPDLQGELDAVGVIELTFKALRNGTSFIVLKTPVLTSEGGGKQGGIARNGRVTIN